MHSLDEVELAEVIEKHSIARNIITNVLIEVNLAGEKTKNGILAEKLDNLVSEMNKFKRISLKGLMAMPPLGTDNRKYFKQLKELLGGINNKSIYRQKLSVLSMGTSGDFETAIEEGATIIRLGTVIFGNRPSKLTKLNR